MLTKQVDCFTKYINVGEFLCHMLSVIILFYSAIFFPIANPISNVTYYFFLLINLSGVVSATYNGVLINHEVAHRRRSVLLSRTFYEHSTSALNHSEN